MLVRVSGKRCSLAESPVAVENAGAVASHIVTGHAPHFPADRDGLLVRVADELLHDRQFDTLQFLVHGCQRDAELLLHFLVAGVDAGMLAEHAPPTPETSCAKLENSSERWYCSWACSSNSRSNSCEIASGWLI